MAEPAALPTVLIVDDQIESLRLLQNILVEKGFRVLLANSGELALEAIPRLNPDLILLDVVMPGTGGFEICRRIKADPRSQNIPILFLSGLNDFEEKLAGFRLGAVDFIAKPVSAEEVVLRVETHWELRRLRLNLEAEVAHRTHELESVLADNKFLMRELQHRVKNHLSLVSGLLTMTEASSEVFDSKELLTKARDRIVSLSALYDLLHHADSLTHLDFSQYTERLLEPWRSSGVAGEARIAVQARVPAVALPVDQLIPLGLMINELVTNAFKYAFHPGTVGTVTVELQTAGSDWVLSVSDDGCGVGEGSCRDVGHGLGWELVAMLSRQLKGEWTTTVTAGTRIEVRFPRATD